MAKAMIVGSAIAAQDLEWLKKKTKELSGQSKVMWIAADGGLKHCLALGIQPDGVVGDWDSLDDPKLLENIPHDTLDEDKDRSDFAHALALGYELGATQMACFGVTGGPRADHHIASLHEIARAAEVGEDQLAGISAHDPMADYYFISTEVPVLKLKLDPGSRVSLFAWNGPAQGVSTSGLEFVLDDEDLNPTSRGLSNRATEPVVEIRVSQGTLLVIVPQSI